jgi:hypothetical protein
MRPSRLIAAGLLCLLAGAARADGPQQVRGQVLDAAGKPVAGAEVATFWNAQGDRMQAYQAARTDAAGKFTLKAQFYGMPQAVLALAPDRKTGALAVVEAKDAGRPLALKLGPLVHVHGSFTCKELGVRPKWTNVYMSVDAGKARVVSCMSNEATFSLWLPPGQYQFWGYGTDIQDHRQELTLSADRPDLDLGKVDVPATIIARHKGKAPPAWHVTDARGLKKDAQPGDFKGKWVLVEFWGFW